MIEGSGTKVRELLRPTVKDGDSSYPLLVPYDTVNLSHNHPPFGTQGRLTLDISIPPYLITPFSLVFSTFYTTGSLWEIYRWRDPGAVCPQKSAAVTVGPTGVSSFLYLVSRLKSTSAIVGFTGGSAAHFLEVVESNWSDPHPGVENGHILF